MKYKTELALIKEQNIDITNFEQALDDFKEQLGKNYDLASRKFTTAIEEIDKSTGVSFETHQRMVLSSKSESRNLGRQMRFLVDLRFAKIISSTMDQ